MAELILSALLPVIFDKLTAVAVNKITHSKEIHSELKKWERKLSQIEAFLEDASQKEVTKVAVKQWLNGLQHLAYDIEDILDALATDAMHHETASSKVLVNLKKLQVENCSKLVSLGEKEEEEDGCNQLTSLRILELFCCESLERCNLPNNIQELSIIDCPMIASVSFPTGGHKLKSFKITGCEQLVEKEVLLNTSMPLMLEVVHINRSKNLKSINELTCFIHITKLMISECDCIESMVELTCFIHLTELTIEDCSSIESFPAADLPNLTYLKHLAIVNCESMEVDSFGLWPPQLGFLRIGGLKKPISKFGPQNFPPSLVDLTLYGGSAEEEEDDATSGSQLSHMLPSSLTTLSLWEFKKLESVSVGLQHLTSLQHLYIWFCPKMKDLPEELLPSLWSLRIVGCREELKEKTSRRGSYWPRISYIPDVYIG